MPDTYRSNRRIPELRGRFRGGVTVLLHAPQEVQGLIALVDAAAALPGDPLATLYRTLAAPDVALAEWPPFASVRARGQEGSEEEGDRERPVDTLRASLALAADVWQDQGPDVRELALAMAIPKPGRRRVALVSDRPALVFDHGSLRARVVRAGRSLRRFGIALFPVARSRRQANLVEALRARRVDGGARPLPRLDGRPLDLDGKDALVVLVHGLFSTDAGTFDALIERMRTDPALAGRVAFTGWPHDSLARIRDNAADLARLVRRARKGRRLAVAFVCHSRGGLVARACAARLVAANRKWRSRLAAAVTFGTPHEGAELAEMGDELLGKVLLLSTMARDGGAVPLVDALWAVHERRSLPGITDLRPRKGGGRFLRRLEARELRVTGRPGAPVLPLLAVGGRTRSAGLAGWLSNRLLAGLPSDLVVHLASSAPATFERTIETACDHFSYFQPTPEQTHLDDAIAFLAARLAPPAAAEDATTHPTASDDDEAPPRPSERSRRRDKRAGVSYGSGPTRSAP